MNRTKQLRVIILLSMVEFGPAFIQAVEHRPKPLSVQAQNIPLIDLSPLSSAADSASLSAVATEVGRACRDWGFFQVINHGVPPECGEKVESEARKFFALPENEKLKVSRDAANPFGYYDGEHTKNVRDWKEVFDFAVENPIVFPVWNECGDLEIRKLFNRWPENFPELREACEEHAAEMEKLAFKLLELVALSLGLRRDRFNAFFKDQTTRVRLNHYPPCPSPHLALGLGRHKDTGVLTVLAQDTVPGLEVKRKRDGEWILVNPMPHAYIINVGDIIQVWSNDEYESVEHRVVVSAEERFSIPYFLSPAHYTVVEPLEELIGEENPPKFKGYNWGEFRAMRNRGNLGKLDVENLQISHFRING